MVLESCGKKFLYFLSEILCGIIALVGLGVLAGGSYIANQTSSSQVAVGIIAFGGALALLTALFMYVMKNSSCYIITYLGLLIIVTLVFLVVGFVIIFKDSIIDDISKQMDEDDKESIDKFKVSLEKLRNVFSIMFLVVTVVCILDFICLFFYRKKVIEHEEAENKEISDGDSLLRSAKGGRKQLFNDDDD